MVPDKFDMVDMGGIDLIMMQGEEVPGLYNRLVESIAQCRYQCLYNWLFDGVIIPPTYVELEVNENDEVEINEGVTVTSDDVIHIYSIEPPAPEPTIISLLAEDNGTYNVPEGVDGFNPVNVSVNPPLQNIEIIENGEYTPSTGYYGFSSVDVDVPVGSNVIVSNSPPTADVGENGQYYIYEATADIKYGIQLITVGRGTNYSFNYWGARDIDFVFTDGENEYHLRNFSNAHCYWAAGNVNAFARQDENINGQTGSYYEHSGLPGWYEISASVPSGLALAKVRICGRNDSNNDFWRTFKIGQWFQRRSFINTLLYKENLVLTDWDRSSTSAYTEFTLLEPVIPEPSIYPHLYQKFNGTWIQYS